MQDALTGTIIGHGTEQGVLYYVYETLQQSRAMLTRGSPDYHLWMWHQTLGHPSLAYLKHLFLSFKNTIMSFNCEACVLAKSHKHSYLPSVTHFTRPFSLIHYDVWGPAPKFGTHKFSYYVLFVDDCTRITWLYFI